MTYWCLATIERNICIIWIKYSQLWLSTDIMFACKSVIWFRDEVNFLGHRLTRKGISTQEEKVKALQGWKTPLTTPKQVKSLLGGFSWYKNYIPHFATLAAPLFALTSTKSKFQWTERLWKCGDSPEKYPAVTAPVLVRWQQELPTRVVTDASKVGLGAVLE